MAVDVPPDPVRRAHEDAFRVPSLDVAPSAKRSRQERLSPKANALAHVYELYKFNPSYAHHPDDLPTAVNNLLRLIYRQIIAEAFDVQELDDPDVSNMLHGFVLEHLTSPFMRDVLDFMKVWIRSPREMLSTKALGIDCTEDGNYYGVLYKKGFPSCELFRISPSPETLQLIRILLQIAGVEQNPGPPKAGSQGKSKAPQPSSTEKAAPPQAAAVAAAAPVAKENKKQSQKPHPAKGPKAAPRSCCNKRARAVQASMFQHSAEEAGARDALRDQVQDLKQRLEDTLDGASAIVTDMQGQLDQQGKQLGSALADVAMYEAMVSGLRDQGYLPREGSAKLTFSFHGCFKTEPRLSSTFNPGDPLVTVNVFDGGRWVTDAFPAWREIFMPGVALTVAANCQATESSNSRFRNILAALNQSQDMRKAVKEMSEDQVLTMGMTMEFRAFLLCGALLSGGRCRWLNECEEWVPYKYVISADQLPADYQERLLTVNFATNTLKFQSQSARNCRAAPIVVDGLIPHIPDASDPTTLIAGLLKRLYPDLPYRRPKVTRKLMDRAVDLARMINMRSTALNVPSREDILEHCLEGRPSGEASSMRKGFEEYLANPAKVLEDYCKQTYKCFIKLEAYPDGSFKPPRFIMMLDPYYRGVQIAAMGRILWRIEAGTRECNVKGLSADQVTEKLKKKFENCDLVAETDFSSFESCINSDMKRHVENVVYKSLCTESLELNFITSALDREEVRLLGPAFTIDHFHHIRMSGDYWTSLGNLITNIVIISYVTKMSVEKVLHVGLFEGDDGCFPAPKNRDEVIARAKRAGVKLTFDIAPWHSLSFCGNHFEDVNGNLVRHRDPRKALANLIILFNPDRTSRIHDFMLQRAKCLSALYGPWIPEACVFAAVVERVTRWAKVDPNYLRAHGLLKNREYTDFKLEGCVPRWLIVKHPDRERSAYLTDSEFCKRVWKRNLAAGGKCDLSTIQEMLSKAASLSYDHTHVSVPSPIALDDSQGGWYCRDGFRFTHDNSLGPISVKSYNDRYEGHRYRRFVHSQTEEHRRNHVVHDPDRWIFDMFEVKAVLWFLLFACITITAGALINSIFRPLIVSAELHYECVDFTCYLKHDPAVHDDVSVSNLSWWDNFVNWLASGLGHMRFMAGSWLHDFLGRIVADYINWPSISVFSVACENLLEALLDSALEILACALPLACLYGRHWLGRIYLVFSIAILGLSLLTICSRALIVASVGPHYFTFAEYLRSLPAYLPRVIDPFVRLFNDFADMIFFGLEPIFRFFLMY